MSRGKVSEAETLEAHVVASVLSYNSMGSLKQVIEAIRVQSCKPTKILVTDNASSDGTANYLSSQQDIEVLTLADNKGVGGGHNEGIGKALKEADCDFVWLLEHDAIPSSTCLAELLSAFRHLEHSSVKPAALVPNVARDKESASGIIDRHSEPFPGAHLTFNGSLFPRHTFEQLGWIREDFFVGFEDSEYLERIRGIGADVYGVPRAILIHRTAGDLRLGVRPSVFRSYYSLRNSAYLDRCIRKRRLAVPMYLSRAVLGCIRSLIFEDDRLRRASSRLAATFDGLAGRLGKRSYWFLES